MLNANSVQLEFGNFSHFGVYGRRKYAEFRELSLKSYEMKIQPVSWLKTQIQFETFAKNYKKIMTWIGNSILSCIMLQIWENAKIRPNTPLLEYFRTVRET